MSVTVAGKPAEVIEAVGYPGAVNGYKVNVRVPDDAEKGLATLQVSVAWILGAEMRIAIQ